MDRPPAPIASEAYDPIRKSRAPKMPSCTIWLSTSDVVGCSLQRRGLMKRRDFVALLGVIACSSPISQGR